MVGAMLVGAWLLIHQQCCVSGELDARMRSPFDSMTRRSPLEKNFMRFGRSWEPSDTRLIRALRSTDNFMRFGKSGNEHQRSLRAKENFIRFGRKDPEETEDLQTITSDDEFQRYLRSKENFMRFGRNQPRDLRSKVNFMRFGRSQFNRDGRSKDNFIRFGRDFSRNLRKDNFIRFGRANGNFMRFGKSGEEHARSARTKDNFIRFGRSGYEDEDDDPELETNESQITVTRKERASSKKALNCNGDYKNNRNSDLCLEPNSINFNQPPIFTS